MCAVTILKLTTTTTTTTTTGESNDTPLRAVKAYEGRGV